jgi:hypothetical protein
LPEFLSADDVARWAQRSPPEAGRVLAARAALRAIPVLSAIDMPGGRRLRETIVLRMFRAATVAWVAARYPTHRLDLGEAAAAASILSGKATAYEHYPGVWDAFSAAVDAASLATKRFPTTAAAMVARAVGAAAAAAEDALIADRALLFQASARDAGRLDIRNPPEDTADTPLWPIGTPEPATRALAQLKQNLPLTEGWDVWTNWYDARVEGLQADEALEVARATVDDDIWVEGPKIVNAHIKWLIDEHGTPRDRPRRSSISYVETRGIAGSLHREVTSLGDEISEPPDPDDADAFHHWLAFCPREWAIALAARAALRILPLARPSPFDIEDIAKVILPIFWAMAIARFAAAYPGREITDGSALLGDLLGSPEIGVLAATSVASKLYSIAARASELGEAAPSLAAEIIDESVSVFPTYGLSVRAALAALRRDALLLSDRLLTPERLARAPLWQMGESLTDDEWKSLRSALFEHSNHWQVWIDWYEYVLLGSPPAPEHNEAWEAAFTDVPGPLPWDDGPEAVNTEIARRLRELAPKTPSPGQEVAHLAVALDAETSSPVLDAPTLSVVPASIPNVLSPIDFVVSAGRSIRATPSVEVQPVLKTTADKRDHKPRLELCRATAASMIVILDQRRSNVREGYRHALSEYLRYLPVNTRKRNFLLADQEARILRDMFQADTGTLPPDFASRLRNFLIAHQGLRVFYPGVERLYADVRFGRSSQPLPLDATDEISRIVSGTPEVFDSSVEQALVDTAPSLPAAPAEPPVTPDTGDIKPPPDPLDTLSTEKARDHLRARVINRLWSVFQKGEPVAKHSEAWIATAHRLAPHVRRVIDWLSSVLPPS